MSLFPRKIETFGLN